MQLPPHSCGGILFFVTTFISKTITMTPDVTFATPADLVTYINANIKNRVGSDVIIPQEHNNIENGIVSFLGYTFPILYADLVTTIAGGTLITNGTYNITDRGIYLKATRTTTISSNGLRVMK